MPVILGIDPGSRVTGYGVICVEGKKANYLGSGCIRIPSLEIGKRLSQIFNGLQEIMRIYQPQEIAIEQIFMHRNPNTALKLGQARGVAIVATTMQSVPIAEYSVRQIKQCIVGYGAASKVQIQHMVQQILGLSGKPQTDAADALAVALCHAHMRNNKILQKRDKT